MIAIDGDKVLARQKPDPSLVSLDRAVSTSLKPDAGIKHSMGSEAAQVGALPPDIFR
jgi:hypothetical protein